MKGRCKIGYSSHPKRFQEVTNLYIKDGIIVQDDDSYEEYN